MDEIEVEQAAKRFEQLETHAIKTEGRLDTIERTQHQHGSKLDQIVTAVTRYDSRPVFDIQKTVSMVRDVFAICAVIASLSVWLVLTLTSSRDAATTLEISYLKERLDEQRALVKSVLNVTTVTRSQP